MSKLTPAQQEALYDAQRSGAAYVKPGADTVWADVLNITDDPTDAGATWAEIIDIVTDTPLSDTEARAIDILLARPVVRSKNQAHREERMIAILEQIAELPEPAQSETLRMLERALDAT